MICVTQEGIAASNAAALKTAGPPGTQHLDQQGSLAPAPLGQLRQQGTGNIAQGALNESIASSPMVERLDFATASGEGNLAQTGPRRPSGDPGNRAQDHTAPTGYGATFRENATREGYSMYLPGPKRGN